MWASPEHLVYCSRSRVLCALFVGMLAASAALACGGKAGQPDGDAAPAGGATVSTATEVTSAEGALGGARSGVGAAGAAGSRSSSGGAGGAGDGESGSAEEVLISERSCPPRDDLDIGTNLGVGNNVFRVMCGRCHDPEGGSEREIAEPYFSGLGDAVGSGLLDPCNPSDSPLVQSMSQGRMPPAGEAIGFADLDRQAIESAIPSLCEPEPLDRFFCIDAPGYPGCDVVNLETFVDRECSPCHGADAAAEHRAGGARIDAHDLRSLIDAGWVVPCGADDSPLVRVLRAGEVAPHDRCVQFPRSRRVEQIAAFIDASCVP